MTAIDWIDIEYAGLWHDTKTNQGGNSVPLVDNHRCRGKDLDQVALCRFRDNQPEMQDDMGSEGDDGIR